MTILFGPSGIGPVKEAIKNLEEFSKLGIKSCEIDFTYGVYIKKKEDAEMIGKKAKEFGIKLSIHAPYWINLNSLEKDKIEKSKQRIIECCRIGTYLNAYRIVFHSGFYGKMSKEETYENIKNRILEIKKEIEEKKYTPKLAPEIMGKINVFGSIEEIKKLTLDTNCECCIDFAHILARYKEDKIAYTLNLFKEKKELHLHYSGIEYNEKGEKRHKKTNEEDLKKLIKLLPKDKEIVLINESPYPLEDSLLGIRLQKELKN